MYVLHGRILSLAEELRIPQTLHAKIASQILFDFLISVIPILGIFFSYLNQCSTRNAAMIYNHVCNQSKQNGEQGITIVSEGYTAAEDWNAPWQVQNNFQLQEQAFIQKPKPPKKKLKKPGQITVQEVGVMQALRS